MFTKLLFVLTILVFTIIFWIGNSTAQQFVTDGLIGFWTMEPDTVSGDVLKDAFGKNDGKIVGAPKAIAGKIGKALDFNGKTDYVLLPDMGNEPAVTVEAWTLSHSQPPAAHSCCIGIVSSAPEDQWKAGTVHFKFEAGLITIDMNGVGKLTFNGAKIEEWYHAAYTCDTTKNEFKLYINGALVVKGAAGAVPNNLTHIRIASEHEGRYLPGIVDEVRIYNRALDEDEMLNNFKVTSNSTAVNGMKKLSVTWGMIKY